MGFMKQLDLFIQDYSENEEEYYKLLNEIDYYLHNKEIPKSEKAREILRKFIDSLTESYKYIVIDNEAGLEHLNRRLTDRIDFLWIVSDHSIRGIRTAKQILEIIAELKLSIKYKGLVINRSPDGLDSKIMEDIDSITAVADKEGLDQISQQGEVVPEIWTGS